MGNSLRIGIITAYPEEDWHSRQLIDAAGRRAECLVIRPEQLRARVGHEGVTLSAASLDLRDVDGFLLARGFGDLGNPDFLVPVYQKLEQSGKVLVNSIEAVLTAIDKFETTCRFQQAGVPTPPVVVTQEAGTAHAVVRDWGLVVAKPLFGSLGQGIELLADTPESHALVPGLLARFGAVYLQQYIESTGRDIRAFVVGPRVVSSMYRVPAPGDWRANLARGGQAVPCELDAATAGWAVAAAHAVGLDYTGVDILEGPEGPVVIEVNGNPLWRGLQDATGCAVADTIVDWTVERITRLTVKGGAYHA